MDCHNDQIPFNSKGNTNPVPSVLAVTPITQVIEISNTEINIFILKHELKRQITDSCIRNFTLDWKLIVIPFHIKSYVELNMKRKLVSLYIEK